MISGILIERHQILLLLYASIHIASQSNSKSKLIVDKDYWKFYERDISNTNRYYIIANDINPLVTILMAFRQNEDLKSLPDYST